MFEETPVDLRLGGTLAFDHAALDHSARRRLRSSITVMKLFV
jgi:hypothetical protein